MFDRENLSASLKCLGITDVGNIFDELAEQYCSPSRHYHSDQHVSECLRHFASYSQDAEHPAEIEVAIWFHDAVYDSQQSNNEELSALWAKNYLSDKGVETEVVDRIEQMILATKTHLPFNQDTMILLDIDLGILGSSCKAFDAYDRAVRREYQWVDDEKYEAGRKQVLASFLERDVIYHTDQMHKQFEAQARKNIKRRIGL